MNKTVFSLLALWLFMATASAKAQINIPQWPEDKSIECSADYEVSVRTAHGTWQALQVMSCQVNLASRSKASFAEFDMGGPVVVRVVNNKNYSSVIVRPQSSGINVKKVDAHTVEFALKDSKYLSIEYDGDKAHNLHLFANPMCPQRPDSTEKTIVWQGKNAQDVFVKDANLIYFAPGIHKPKDLPSEEIKIPSNCTVYLSPGAVVKARFIVDHAENVRIIGRGIIDHPLRGIEITFSRNVVVDGPTVLNPKHYTVYGGQSENITIRHLKSFSAMSWSDGIDLMCCRNVTIEDVFLRTSDDCLALYNHRWWYWGGTENIRMRRATLWADVAHPVNIGSHGDDRSNVGETLRDVCIEDCDILYARTNAALNISCGDKNWIRDVTFRDIRVERLEGTALIGLAVVYGAKYNRAPGNGIDNITFDCIQFAGDSTQLRPNFFNDYDETHRIGKNIIIK